MLTRCAKSAVTQNTIRNETVETNFIPGGTFQNLEDLNRQALEWSTVRMEQRPQGKAGLSEDCRSK